MWRDRPQIELGKPAKLRNVPINVTVIDKVAIPSKT